MRNQETIEEFKQAYETLVATRDVPEKTEFEIQDLTLNKEHMLQLDGINLSENATKQVLGILKVKSDFPIIADEIGDADFNVILGLLKTARSENPLVATIKFTNTGKDVIPFIERIYINKDVAEQSSIKTDDTVLAISKALNESEIDFRFGAANIEPRNNKLAFSFITDEEPVDVFNTGADTWSVGYEVLFNENSFDIYPIYERLVCSNGMRSITKSKSTNISKNKFNEETIFKITKRIFKSTNKIKSDLVDRVNYMKTNNLSLDELKNIGNWVQGELDMVELKSDVTQTTKDEIYDSFDLSKYDNIYHTEVLKKKSRWLSTADSGVNAYDMLNQITNISTHIVADVTVPVELSIIAGYIFFRDKFDLGQIAGHADIPAIKNALMA